MLLYALVPTLPRLDSNSNPDVEDYLEKTPSVRSEKLKDLVDSIREEFSDLRESLKYGMPTFERNGRWVAFSNHKSHLSIYFCEESFVRAFRAKFPKSESGKNYVSIKDKEKFPSSYLKTLLKKTLH
ncbi:iron chaperone [Leptospira licerasiae]|uniref:PF08818 domain protein n=1 Tax=Leptospira licerasiae str. MMD4847 TaxID=1049971 RepID=A0ABN0H7Q0_9LEPT|nr:DUF1801 domain-containing protein [Leptospira licerasiae]EID99755.1 hypothetical protein LEP1GSC185_0717 [Leptospira licerasiae serovar Varillal str. VAR 010]EJZ41582.1 PF08818 domain protein [Leptospira licerasiae str. MMD4847]TGM91041.1 DUF1801 domain-containing protein [Leptospira licerasiae]